MFLKSFLEAKVFKLDNIAKIFRNASIFLQFLQQFLNLTQQQQSKIAKPFSVAKN